MKKMELFLQEISSKLPITASNGLIIIGIAIVENSTGRRLEFTFSDGRKRAVPEEIIEKLEA